VTGNRVSISRYFFLTSTKIRERTEINVKWAEDGEEAARVRHLFALWGCSSSEGRKVEKDVEEKVIGKVDADCFDDNVWKIIQKWDRRGHKFLLLLFKRFLGPLFHNKWGKRKKILKPNFVKSNLEFIPFFQTSELSGFSKNTVKSARLASSLMVGGSAGKLSCQNCQLLFRGRHILFNAFTGEFGRDFGRKSTKRLDKRLLTLG
jgi:hypothetical protein